MTSVYGVTFVGAREQIKRRLKERGVFSDDQELHSAACYAAKVRKKNMDSMLSSLLSLCPSLLTDFWMNAMFHQSYSWWKLFLSYHLNNRCLITE